MKVYIWFLAIAIAFGIYAAHKTPSPREKYNDTESMYQDEYGNGGSNTEYADYLPFGRQTIGDAIMLAMLVAVIGAVVRRVRFRPLRLTETKTRLLPFFLCIAVTIATYLIVYRSIYC